MERRDHGWAVDDRHEVSMGSVQAGGRGAVDHGVSMSGRCGTAIQLVEFSNGSEDLGIPREYYAWLESEGHQWCGASCGGWSFSSVVSDSPLQLHLQLVVGEAMPTSSRRRASWQWGLHHGSH